jgi:hypothetical protein
MALVNMAGQIDADTKERRSVLVKFVKINEDESIDRIITATNSQNPMPPAARRALDPFQRQIEDWLKHSGLYYERRRNYYRSRNFSINDIVSMEYLGQAIMSARMRRPGDARARPSSLLKDDSRYTIVFDKSIDLEEYKICTQIAKRVDSFLSSTHELSASDRTNARFYVMMVSVDLLLGKTQLKGREVREVAVQDFTDELLLGSLVLVQERILSMAREGNVPEDRIAKGNALAVQLTEDVTKILQ